MSIINQKEYLKKYLSKNLDKPKKKKTKKKDKIAPRVRIIDDDADFQTFNEAVQEDLLAANEDAPQIVGIIDDRPVELRMDDFKKEDVWKPVHAIKQEELEDSDEEDGKIEGEKSNHKGNYSDDNISPPRKRDEKNESLPTRETNDDYSPPRRKKRDMDSPRRQNGDDFSPPRRKKDHDDNSPPRRKRNDDIPPRRIKNERESPPRIIRNDKKRDEENNPLKKNVKDEDNSPPRRKNNYNSPSRQKVYEDNSPPRKRAKDEDKSPPRRKRKGDISPPRRNNVDNPPRRSNKDQSPVRRNRIKEENCSTRRNDGDSPPKRNKRIYDNSPPRRVRNNENNSPPRSSKDNSPSRNKKQYSNSPRRTKSPVGCSKDASPIRKKPRYENKVSENDEMRSERDKSPTRRNEKKSRWGEPSSTKMTKTLDGKSAGLQNAKDLVKETQKLKKREEDLFKNMAAEVSGVNSQTIIRDRKTGKIRNLEEERVFQEEKSKEQAQIKEKYDKWGKGTKQVEDYNEKLKQDVYEMNKPLARYADDEDLERYLKDQEREGDPMLAYIKKKKKKDAVDTGKPMRPQYEGEFMPNRFGIRPGHKWDGVDRSSGYEKKWFEVQNSKQAQREEAYRWNTEDM